MATEEKKVSKLDSILNKIDDFFEGLMSAKKSDDMEEDDDMGATKADDEPEAATAPTGKSKSKKATDDEDSQDPDDDGDDDEDEDGEDDDDKTAAAEIAALKATIKKQNKLLSEAKEALAERDETVRETIKSTFKPTGSQRTTKVAAKNEMPSWATPTTELGKKAAKMASINKNKR